jgi:hypothetical protein
MKIRVYAAGLCAAVIAVTALAVPPVAAQSRQKQKQQQEYIIDSSGRLIPVNRSRTRVVVAPRSFLDAGTEVRPGERKFTDYAFPPTYTAIGVVSNTGGKVGWDRSPFMQPFQLPGFTPW